MTATAGERIITASWAGTAVLASVSLAGLVARDLVAPVVVGVSVVMFAVGCVLFFAAYARAVGRSRTELVGVGGVYFLSDSAPRRVRTHLLGSLAAQCAVVVVVIAVAPFTSLVMTALAPMYAIGCAGLWGARLGTFPARAEHPS